MSESQLTRVETFPFAYGAICDACKENGNPMPHYQIDGNDFTVVFDALEGTAKDGLIYKDNLNPGQNTWDAEHGKVRMDSKATEKSSQKSSQKIIELIKMDKTITTQTMADKIGISRRAVAKQIAILQEKKVIRRVGGAKGGYWEIVGKENV